MTTTRTDLPQRFRADADYQLFIDGDWVRPAGAFAAVDPSTGIPWASLGQASVAQVEAAVAAARRALQGWRRTSLAARQRILWQIADRIEQDPDRWARLLATENGRPIREAYIADVPAATAIFRYFSGLVRDLRGDQIPVEDPFTLAYTTREPIGVVAAVLPWNSPIISFANKVAPALATGNCVVVKPSEFATASIMELVTLIADLLPAGVLNVVSGFGPEVGSALVSHPDVALVTLTGGGPTARKIMAGASASLTPTLMELGGKGAMIVADDADLDLAVADALKGIYLANGEACIASSRLLLHTTIADDFLERFAEAADVIRVGDALDMQTQVGPLVSRVQRDRVRAHLVSAREDGVEMRAGAGPLDLPEANAEGFFVRPTLLHDRTGTSRIARDEVFGPVTVAETFESYDDAVARANDTPYGLAAGVWTADLTRAHTIARELDAGIVWVNKWFDLPVGVPMGGVKDSGFGREQCLETLRDYSTTKVVNIDLGAPRPQLWG